MNFQKLSPSERRLVAIFGFLIAVLLNFVLVKFFLKNRSEIAELMAQKSAQVVAMKALSEKASFWKERSEWMRTAQPRIESEASAGNLLLNFLKENSAKNGLTFSKQQLVAARSDSGFTSIPVKFELKGSWKGLCQFLIDLQAPDRFLVVQDATLRVDSADATMMLGDFTIAKWFATR
jgi:Tfp pilus assembly protein PilO